MFGINYKHVLWCVGFFIAGAASGSYAQHKYDESQTPEEVKNSINEAKKDYEAYCNSKTKYIAEQELRLAKEKTELHNLILEKNRVLDNIVKTKESYQNEIRPELEKKIRKELEQYISKADKTYADAEKKLSDINLKMERLDHKEELIDLKLKYIEALKNNSSDDIKKAVLEINV